jgi:hypothetical protein
MAFSAYKPDRQARINMCSLGGGCHLFFKKLGEHLLLLVVRVYVRPGKWTNTCRACRRGAM